MTHDEQQKQEIIEQIRQTLINTGVLQGGFADETMLLEWKKSTSRDGAQFKMLTLDDEAIEPFAAATVRKGSGKQKVAGQRYYLFAIPLDEPMAVIPADSSSEPLTEKPAKIHKQTAPIKPYGPAASILYKNGWFQFPPVLAAIGSDKQFLAWIRQQPCAMTGDFDYFKDEATGTTVERCDAAHVRRVADGAGTAIKPPYSAIPLVHYWHDHQSQKGESVFSTPDQSGREWMEKKRDKYVTDWASHTLAKSLGYESMGYVPPLELIVWAKEQNLYNTVPAKYKNEAKMW